MIPLSGTGGFWRSIIGFTENQTVKPAPHNFHLTPSIPPMPTPKHFLNFQAKMIPLSGTGGF
jgi:hypothetical protein